MTRNIQTIHIFGASGSGTSTLGRALAQTQGRRFLDTDDYFWKTKYSEIHPAADRLAGIRNAIDGCDRWVLSGSLCGWGDVLVPLFDLAVFLSLPHEVRMERLRHRERERFGDRILPGGPRHGEYAALMEWAAKYDSGGLEIRSRRTHEAWIATLPCPVLRLEGELSLDQKLQAIENYGNESCGGSA